MKYLTYTTWHRDRGGKLILRQKRYRVVGRPLALERGLAMRDGALATLTAAVWFFAVLAIALNSMGCASADGYDSPPESASPEAQALFSSAPHGWCCDAWDEDGKRYLECGLETWPAGHADEVGDRCYCHGVVSGDECRDNTAWTPGTFCTQAQLVCRESE